MYNLTISVNNVGVLKRNENIWGDQKWRKGGSWGGTIYIERERYRQVDTNKYRYEWKCCHAAKSSTLHPAMTASWKQLTTSYTGCKDMQRDAKISKDMQRYAKCKTSWFASTTLLAVGSSTAWQRLRNSARNTAWKKHLKNSPCFLCTPTFCLFLPCSQP